MFQLRDQALPIRSGCQLFFVIPIAVLAINATIAGGEERSGYAVKHTLAIGGDGGFDYATIDRDGKLLYLPRSSHTQVVDVASGKVVADIPDNSRSHGVALVPEEGRGFISNGGDGTVQVFDLKSNQSLDKIKAAEDADCIIYDPASKNVLAFCGDANEMVSVPANVDVKDGKANATVDLGGKPEFAVSDGQGKVFVNLVDKDKVAVIDTKEMKVIDKWTVAPGGKPVSMAMDRSAKRLFVGCRNQKLIVLSAADGKVIAELPIGAGVDATAFRNGVIFASCGDGTLSVIREASSGKYEVSQVVKTAPRAKTMAIDDKTGTIYLPTAEGQGRSITPGSFKVLVVEPPQQ
jgi:DNA-binding beta-propeller fold protein YncE